MSEPADPFERLLEVFNLKRKDNADGIAAITALSDLKTREEMHDHSRRMGAVQDAFWKKRCEGYEPPEADDVSNNLVNCTFISDDAINKLATVIGDTCDGDGPSVGPPIAPPNNRPKWWKLILSTLAAVLIGAGIVFLVAQYFLDVGGDGGAQYEIIASDGPLEPGRPFEASDFQ